MIPRAFAPAAAILAAALGCSRRPATYEIGVAGPQTVSYGIQNQHGVQLAVDEINHAGGINGVPLRTVVRDDHASGPDAARIAGEFVADPSILAVVGHEGSGAEVAAAHVYNAGHLAAVAPTPSSPDLTGVSPWVFRMITSDSVNGITLARFADALADSLGRPVRAGVLFHNDAYGRGLADAFERSFRGVLINSDPVTPNESFEPFVAYYRQTHPDVVLVASDEDVGIAFLREARRQGLRATFIGGDGWQGIVTDSASEGAFVGTPFTALRTDSAARRFTAAFRARYGVPPDAQAALAYDATCLVAQALAESGGTRDGVRRYLSSLTAAAPFHGVAGPVWFARTNDPAAGTFAMTRVVHGMLVPVTAP